MKGLIGKLPDGIIKNFATGTVDKVTELVSSMVGGALGNGGSRTAGGTNLDSWIASAMGITGVPASWAAGLRTLIMRESGGNPSAINNDDVNARNGDPSRGLMQTIGATFAQYRDKSLINDIMDPVANIVAGINYIKARYGDIANVQQANPNLPPKGYDSGGWLAPGATLTMNRTGVPEAVLNPAQWSTAASAVRAAIQSTSQSPDLALARSGASMPVVVNVIDRDGSYVDRMRGEIAANDADKAFRGTGSRARTYG